MEIAFSVNLIDFVNIFVESRHGQRKSKTTFPTSWAATICTFHYLYVNGWLTLCVGIFEMICFIVDHIGIIDHFVDVYTKPRNKDMEATWFNMQAVSNACELKWNGGWSTGTVDWLSASERGQYLDGCPAMNTKCLVPLPFLPDLLLWSTENRSHGSPVLRPLETQ